MSPGKVGLVTRLNQSAFSLGVGLAMMMVLALGPARVAAKEPVPTPDHPFQMVTEANNHYLEGNFSKAIMGYDAVLDAGYESGPLYYNLGNAYFQLGQKGRAVSYYYKALRFIPGDGDLRANLQLALADLDQPAPNIWQQYWPRLVYCLSFNQWTILTSVCFFLVLAGLGGRVLAGLSLTQSSKGWDRWSLTLWRITGVLMVLGLGMTIISGRVQSVPQGVVVQPVVDAGFEPHPAAAVSMALTEGSRIYILEQNGEWSLVRQSGGRQGWVPRDSYQSI